MDVRFRQEFIEIPWRQRLTHGALEHSDFIIGAVVDPGKDLFVLISLIESNHPPGEMIVDRGRRSSRHYQAGKRESAIARAIQQPHSDAAAHAAPFLRFTKLGR